MAGLDPRSEKPKGRLVFWALFSVCALPVVCAWILILNPGFLPERRSNHGVLIRPPVQLPENAFDRMDGPGFSSAELRGKWIILMVLDADSDCTASCRNLLYQLRQVRQATGKDRVHVEVLVLYLTNTAPGALSVVREYPGVHAAGFNDTGVDVMTSVLQEAGVHERPGVVVVDPLGKLMMHYPHDVRTEDMLKDLRRLLRATRDWLPAL